MKKRSLLSMMALMFFGAPAFAQSSSQIIVSIAEPSTISLIAAGAIALGLARRRVDKTSQS